MYRPSRIGDHDIIDLDNDEWDPYSSASNFNDVDYDKFDKLYPLIPATAAEAEVASRCLTWTDNQTLAASMQVSFALVISGARPEGVEQYTSGCLLYTSPSPRDRTRSRMPSSA